MMSNEELLKFFTNRAVILPGEMRQILFIHRITQKEIIEHCSEPVEQAALSNWLNGKQDIRLKTYERICDGIIRLLKVRLEGE